MRMSCMFVLFQLFFFVLMTEVSFWVNLSFKRELWLLLTVIIIIFQSCEPQKGTKSLHFAHWNQGIFGFFMPDK